MDGEIRFAVSTKTVAAALLAPEITRGHLAHAEYLSVKAQHHLGIERVVGNVADSRKLFLLALRHAETFSRYAHRQTFRIMNPDFAVMDVVRLLENHAARIEGQEFSLDYFEIVDFQADVVQPEIHLHLAQLGASLEEG